MYTSMIGVLSENFSKICSLLCYKYENPTKVHLYLHKEAINLVYFQGCLFLKGGPVVRRTQINIGAQLMKWQKSKGCTLENRLTQRLRY